MRRAIRALGPILLAVGSSASAADGPALRGEWRTSLGVVTFEPDGDAIVAAFADPRTPAVKGNLKGKAATLTYREGERRGDASVTLDDSGRSFQGWYQYGEGPRTLPRRPWNGWRPDPEATRGETGRFDGLWLTTSGLMELRQDGDKVVGRYARYGPVKIAGAFPISAGVIFQCEPDAYKDEALRASQRSVPLAIVHGRTDPMVAFGLGRHAADTLRDRGWPAIRLFASETAGHMFMRLPVGEAIRWLEAMTSDDPETLVALAEKEAAAGRYRDAVAALRRLRGLGQDDGVRRRADRLRASIDETARAKADEFLAKIEANADGSWVDDFLAFRGEFAFADGARAAMDAFDALRKRQEPAAEAAFQEAMRLFRQGKPDEGYAKYREIVEKDYASTRYRDAKEQLKGRK